MIMTTNDNTNVFSAEFSGKVGQSIWTAIDGFTITARLEDDYDTASDIFSPDSRSNPWCGLVSDWTSRAAQTGERVVSREGGRSNFLYARYYNFARAVDHAMSNGLSEEQANEMAEANYQRLVSFVSGDWSYVCVVLSVSKRGIMLDYRAASLCGLESDDAEHLTETANQLVGDAIAAGQDMIAELNK
jgi:hypothetical protein